MHRVALRGEEAGGRRGLAGGRGQEGMPDGGLEGAPFCNLPPESLPSLHCYPVHKSEVSNDHPFVYPPLMVLAIPHNTTSPNLYPDPVC